MGLVLLHNGWVTDRGVHFIATTPRSCQYIHSLCCNHSISSASPRVVIPLGQVLELYHNLLAKVASEAIQLIENWHDLVGCWANLLSDLICRLYVCTQICLADILQLFRKHRDFPNNHVEMLLLFVLLVPQSFDNECVIDLLRPDPIEIVLQLILLQFFAL